MERTLKQSLDNAKRIEEELPHLIQPSNNDYDMVNMMLHIGEMKMLIIDLQASIRAIANNSNSMLSHCDSERIRLSI